jgi:hypothetical protein
VTPQELQQAIDSTLSIVKGDAGYNEAYKRLREVALAHVAELYKVQAIRAAAVTLPQVYPSVRPGAIVEAKK